MKNKNRFFDLLVLNNQKKIHDHIIANGKSKPICPIRFLSEEEINSENSKSKNS